MSKLKDMVLDSKTKTRKLKLSDYVSTGSTQLNLACTGRWNRGFAKGHYYFLVGDSSSGKTWLSLSCLAEAAINKNFDDYRFIYDNGEGGALMNIRKFFGPRVAERIEPPRLDDDGEPLYSRLIEEFYFNLEDAFDDGRPFIYIQDSMDVLSSIPEETKFQERKKAHEKQKETTGTMTDGKAKINSQDLRRMVGKLQDTDNILIIINQTRDNIGFGFNPKTRSGGHALTYYACLEMWSSVAGQITKTVRKKKRQLGTYCKVKIKKNRVQGKNREVIIPIYWSIGIDDIGSCVDYLVDEETWKKKGQIIIAEELDLKGTRESIIHKIEKKGLETKVRKLVGQTWDEIEKACELKRKPRYE